MSDSKAPSHDAAPKKKDAFRDAAPHVLVPRAIVAIAVAAILIALFLSSDDLRFNAGLIAFFLAITLTSRILVTPEMPYRHEWTWAVTLGFLFGAYLAFGAIAAAAIMLVSSMVTVALDLPLRERETHQTPPARVFDLGRGLLGVLAGGVASNQYAGMGLVNRADDDLVTLIVFIPVFLIVQVFAIVAVCWRGEPAWIRRPIGRFDSLRLGPAVPALIWELAIVLVALAAALVLDTLALRLGRAFAVGITVAGLAGIARVFDLNRTLRDRNRALARATAELRTLNAIGQVLTATLDLDDLCDELARQVRRVVPADTVMIGLWDATAADLEIRYQSYAGVRQPVRIEHLDDLLPIKPSDWAASFGQEALPEASPDAMTVGIAAQVIRTRMLVMGPDVETFPMLRDDGSLLPEGRSGERHFQSAVGVPLQTGGRVIGVLSLKRHRPDAYGPEQAALLTSIANQAAVAIHNARQFAEQRAAVQAKQDFLAIVSHELRTPITSVTGYTQLLRRRLTKEAEGDAGREEAHRPIHAHLDLVRVVEEQSRHLGRLVDDLIQLSQLEAGRMTFVMDTVDLAELARDSLHLIELGDTDVQRITMDVSVAALLQGDPLRLRQVVDNLLENAVKYAPSPATIDVRVRASEIEVELLVADTGPGIPPENLPYLFDSFYRVEGPDGTIRRGLGLGLSICREIITAHHGEISVRSELGAGTSFRCMLPTMQPLKAYTVDSDGSDYDVPKPPRVHGSNEPDIQEPMSGR